MYPYLYNPHLMRVMVKYRVQYLKQVEVSPRFCRHTTAEIRTSPPGATIWSTCEALGLGRHEHRSGCRRCRQQQKFQPRAAGYAFTNSHEIAHRAKRCRNEATRGERPYILKHIESLCESASSCVHKCAYRGASRVTVHVHVARAHECLIQYTNLTTGNHAAGVCCKLMIAYGALWGLP